jgi:hypothetical protein
MNQCWFRHSARNLLLKISMKALSVGVFGREKTSTMLLMYAYRSMSRETNALPETTQIEAGYLSPPQTRSNTSITSAETG